MPLCPRGSLHPARRRSYHPKGADLLRRGLWAWGSQSVVPRFWRRSSPLTGGRLQHPRRRMVHLSTSTDGPESGTQRRVQSDMGRAIAGGAVQQPRGAKAHDLIVRSSISRPPPRAGLSRCAGPWGSSPGYNAASLPVGPSKPACALTFQAVLLRGGSSWRRWCPQRCQATFADVPAPQSAPVRGVAGQRPPMDGC